MSGNIQGVNISKLISEKNEYRKLAEQIADDLSNIYKNMVILKAYWTGKRVNQVIEVWNNNYLALKANISYFGYQIYNILVEIWMQYYDMEQGNAHDIRAAIAFPNAEEINKIELTDESNITFEKAKVETTFDNINGYVTKANSELNQIVEKLDSMQAYSDSLKTLATTYKGTANSTQGSLMKICNVIQEELRKAIQDVNETEGYNEEDAQRAGSSSQGGEQSAQ